MMAARCGHTTSVPNNKGGTNDMNANKCIACTVKNCTHHCGTENYCSLEKVSIGTHESNPSMDQCTDCLSFCKK